MSLGDTVDKFTILHIKKERVIDPEKRLLIEAEYNTFDVCLDTELLRTNTILWNIEDSIRIKEANGVFDQEFITLARAVYKNNHVRFQLKTKINENSVIKEQKQHPVQKTKQSVTVLGHMGLGDHIACNGLIRYLSDTYDLTVCTKHIYLENLQYMFRDLPNVNFLTGEDDSDVVRQLHGNVIRLGYFNTPYPELSDPMFDRAFYKDAGVDYSVMRDRFFILRDFFLEDKLYKQVVDYLGTDDYIVVHDDPSRNYKIHVQTDKAIFYIGKGRTPVEGKTIFEYRKVITNAKEYHGFDSSFMWMIELWKIPVKNKYIHANTRQFPDYISSWSSWNVLKN